jgi:hypothetical protein
MSEIVVFTSPGVDIIQTKLLWAGCRSLSSEAYQPYQPVVHLFEMSCQKNNEAILFTIFVERGEELCVLISNYRLSCLTDKIRHSTLFLGDSHLWMEW